MEVNRITKKLRITPQDSVRYQLITSIIFFRKETLTPSELDILVYLALEGEVELGKFCNETTKKMYVIEKMEQFSTKAQNVRNIINKLVKRGFIDKSLEPGRKSIKVHPEIEIHYQGNVLLDYNFLSVNQ
jgi:DNA-binding MarR family transcriptional regulator